RSTWRKVHWTIFLPVYPFANEKNYPNSAFRTGVTFFLSRSLADADHFFYPVWDGFYPLAGDSRQGPADGCPNGSDDGKYLQRQIPILFRRQEHLIPVYPATHHGIDEPGNKQRVYQA